MSSIIIPAHNEAAVIGRCLSSILADAEPGEFEILVVCNGCTDDTPAIAAGFGDDVRVVDCPVASKPAALNLGAALGTRFPHHFVDADIEVGTDDIRRVDAALRSGAALIAAPRVVVDTSDASWAVRAFWNVWRRLPYANDDLVGAGYYGMSKAARSRFTRFPDIVADDLWAHHLVAPEERVSVDGATFTMRPARTLPAQLRVRVRHVAANRVYQKNQKDVGGLLAEANRRQASELARLCRYPWLWPSLGVYLGVNLAARALCLRSYREKEHSWARDDTTRSGSPYHGGMAMIASAKPKGRLSRRVLAATRSVLDPRIYLHALKLLHYYNYTHISERPKVAMGKGVHFAPNVSLVDGQLIAIGDRSHVSAHCSLWAGPTQARITVGDDVLMAPEVFVTTSGYGKDPGLSMAEQPQVERDVVIGNDVWLGAKAVVLPGVTIGDGCIVGAGAVVARSLPPFSIAVGAPARVDASRRASGTRIEAAHG